MSLFYRKTGFIGIEVVIIASLVMSFGALSANRFVQQGQGSTGAFDKAYEHTKNVVEGGDGLVDNEVEELPEEGEDIESEIRYETKWYYGGIELPELPKEITENYSVQITGNALGQTMVLGATYAPDYVYSDIDGMYGMLWDQPTKNALKADVFVLVGTNWVHYGTIDYVNVSEGQYTGSFFLDIPAEFQWSNGDIRYDNGTIFLEGSQPEQRQVPIKE